MSDPKDKPKFRPLRILAAVLVGLVGSIAIWVATPYNNFIIGASYIADSFLPVAALVIALVLVLGVNPFLRWTLPKLALDKRQLAIIVGMLLVACVLPGQGLLRMLPYSLANTSLELRENKRLADAYQHAGVRPSMFPDKLEHGAETPVAEYFITELPEGQSIPWGAWVRPLVTWGVFLVGCWLMMVGLSLIVLPQWRRNERLPFPLLTVQEALIDEPEKGGFAPLFHKRSFWIAAGVILLLHVVAGANQYDPETIPAVPLKWDLGRLFTEEPLRHLPGHIKTARIYFIFVGMAYFMPTRIGFSIWFFVLAYAGYRVIGIAYFPPFDDGAIFGDQRAGAMVAMTLGILWLGRKHWARVLASVFRRAADEADRRNRKAAIMFLTGCAGMWGFMVWAGVHPLWAVFYVGFGFMVSILITRMVAETGMPFIRIQFAYRASFVKLAPLSWLGPMSLYFSTVIAILFPIASRVSCATMSTHAIGLDRDASPRHQSSFAFLLVVLLIVGLVICGASHLVASYHHSATLDGREQPVSPWGTRQLDNANNDLLALEDGRSFTPAYNQPAHMVFGAALAAGLQIACMVWPKWPIHPIGLIMVDTWYANQAWASVLIGWLLKVLVLRYGGARLYRAARPLFLGIIMGEVFAAVFWGIEPVVRVLLDVPYKIVEVQPY